MTTVATHPRPARDEIQLGSVLAALADPLRRSVVAQLAVEEEGFEQHCSGFALAVSKQARTYHFRILREAGLIETADRGNMVLTRLRRRDIDERFPGLLDLVAADARQSGGKARPATSRRAR